MSIKNFRERSPALIGTISIIALLLGTIGAFFIGELPFVKRAYEINAEFADAAGLIPENQVRVAGIKVGTVGSVELVGPGTPNPTDDDRARVIVTMDIDNGVEIPADAFAEIKLATLLGTKFVDIRGAGGGPVLQAGDVIPLERTSIPYEIYQAQNQGVDVLEDVDGEALNKMFLQLVKLTRTAREEIGTALDGLSDLGEGLAAKKEDLRSLLSGAEDLTGLLADEGDELVTLIDASNDVLGTLAVKREEIQSLLGATRQMAGELTSVLRDNRQNLDETFSRLHSALRVLDRNIDSLDLAFEFAGPSSRYFGSVFSQGRWGDIFNCALLLTGGCEG